MTDGRLVFGPPKSDAGVRVVTVPLVVLPAVEEHLAEYADDDQESLVFVGPKGKAIRRSNFQEHWVNGTSAAGVAGLHFMTSGIPGTRGRPNRAQRFGISWTGWATR